MTAGHDINSPAQMMWTVKATGSLAVRRESFLLDGGYMAVGSIEPQFFAQLLAGLEFLADDVPGQVDSGRYDELRPAFAGRFATKTREECTAISVGTDACVTSVLNWAEAADSEHLPARRTPAPRFSGTPAPLPGTPPRHTTSLDDIDG